MKSKLLFTAILLTVFSLGSVAASVYSCGKNYHDTKKASIVKQQVAPVAVNDVYLNDAIIVEVPVNYIGFHVYPSVKEVDQHDLVRCRHEVFN